MRIGAVISPHDPERVFRDIHHELSSHHDVRLLRGRETGRGLLGRLERFKRRRDVLAFMRSCDVVYFEWASDQLAYVTHQRKVSRIVTRLHRYEMFSWVARINWDAVDRVIVLSEAMQRKLLIRCPQCASKTSVVPWGVSAEKFTMSPRVFNGNIGTLCEIIPRKRIYEQVLDFYELNLRRPGLRFHIAGEPNSEHEDYWDALRSLVARLNLEDQVIFHGRVEDTAGWLKEIDIFVTHSYSEGLQSALLEAMASGCYCLSHRWDGAEEVLPERYLFCSGAELVEKILAYCDLATELRHREAMQMRAIASEQFPVATSLRLVREAIETEGRRRLQQ